MRKRHPLEVYVQGKPFQHQGPDSLHREVESVDEDADWRPSRPPLPRRWVIGLGGALFLGLALVGPWLYTGKFWPASAIGWSGSPDDAESNPWPDRISDQPGGAEAKPQAAAHFVILVSSGILPEDADGRRRDLERWQHEEQRLQQRLDDRYPDEGLVARSKFIRGTETVGLIISRWHSEDDPGLQEVLQWVRELDAGRYAEATRAKDRAS